MSKVIALITDHGDMSVGIWPCFWEVQCPFPSFELEDHEAFFTEKLIDLYKEFSEGELTVDYLVEQKPKP